MSYYTPQNNLEDLLTRRGLASCTTRQVFLEKVRAYIRETPTTQLSKEISEITSLVLLNMLQAAGVPQDLQPTFLFVYQRLTAQ
jgi:hypothetical protein